MLQVSTTCDSTEKCGKLFHNYPKCSPLSAATVYIPKYLEKASALSVALMRMSLRSGRFCRMSRRIMMRKSDSRSLSCISSSIIWLALFNNLWSNMTASDKIQQTSMKDIFVLWCISNNYRHHVLNDTDKGFSSTKSY